MKELAKIFENSNGRLRSNFFRVATPGTRRQLGEERVPRITGRAPGDSLRFPLRELASLARGLERKDSLELVARRKEKFRTFSAKILPPKQIIRDSALLCCRP